MAISKMKKLTLMVSTSIREQLLKKLQVLGSVHIDSLVTPSEEDSVEESWLEDLQETSVDIVELEDQKKEYANALNKITEITGVKAPQFEITSSDVIAQVVNKYDISQTAYDFSVLEKRTKESLTAVSTLEFELEQVERWSGEVDDMSPIHGTSSLLKGVVGHISMSEVSNLISTIQDVTPLAEVIVAWVKDKEAYCYIIADLSVWEEVNAVVKSSSFNILQITKRTGSMNNIIENLRTEITKYKNIYDISIQEWGQHALKIEDIALIHDYLEIEIQNKKANTFALSTEQVSFLRAWVPEDFMPKVEAVLSIHQKDIDVTIEDPTEEEYETVPVLLKNNALTRPFAALTNMYGTPMYGKTVDPTPHFSLFYFLFYGICLGDAVYGFLLALGSAYLMFKNRANQGMANFMMMLMFCGISSLMAGVLFGSYAGDLFIKYIPVPMFSTLKFTFSDGLGIFDKPLLVLFFSVLVGGIQLWYGYFIKFIITLKTNIIDALFSVLPWLILLGGFFAWGSLVWIAGIAGLNIVSSDTAEIFFLLMKIGAVLIILNNMRLGFQKGFMSGIFGSLAGAWELYGISGYLSNLLSYSRLLALGLSSGVMANVFNTLAFGMIESLSGIFPILGVVGVIVLVILHMFNFALGAFGAFVHALRLQFVEFFSQFLEGGGKEFDPLKLKGTHYTVK